MAVPAAAIGAAKMIGGAVGQVGIQLALEKAFFNKDVQETTKKTESAFSKSFERINKTTKSAFNGMGNIASNAMNKVKNSFTETFNKISGIMKVMMIAGKVFLVKFSKDAIQAASDTQAAWTGLYSIVNGTGKSFGKAQGFLKEYVSDGLVPLTDAVTAYKNLAARGYGEKQIEGIMTSLKDAAAFGRQSSYSYGEAIKSATEGLKNENSILVDNAGVTKNVAKMWDEYAASIGTTANNLTLAQKRQAEYQGIMEETKFQQGDAAKYADTYAGKLAKLNTAFFNLKVTVGQVLTPIVELFLPVITKAINGLTVMFNKLKSIMAVFGLEMKEYIGGGASTAISGATESASGLSNGLDSAGTAAQKTAKKIKRAFAGIDEINVLNMPNNSSSSGGAGGSSDSGIGGTGAGADGIGGAFDDTKETVTQNLEWLNRSAYDWGVAFGEAINKGLNLIPWDKIQGGVIGVVSKVAQFLNGAVAGLDWHLLGSTFGEGFNTVIYGLNTWYETFDWSNFGKGLGDGVNGIIDSVDWQATGKFFALKFNSIFETSSGFLGTVKWGDLGKNLIEGLNTTISTLDFTAVGKTLENGFNGAIDFMWNAVTNFDFKNAGSKAGDLINNISTAIKNTDWNKLGKTVSEALTGSLDAIQQFLKDTDWGELVSGVIDGVVDFLVGIDWGKLLPEVGATLVRIGLALVEGIWAGIKSALVGVAKILWDILVQPIIDGVKKLFGIHSPSTVFAEIGDFLIQGLWSGISGAKDWIVKKWSGVKNWFSDIKKEAKVEIKQKWSDIKEKWSNLTKNIKSKTADMKAKVATTWSNLKSKWSDTTKNIKDKTADMKARVATTWSNLRTKWNNLMSNFKDKTIEIKAKVGNVIGSFKSTINDKIIKPINKKLPSFFPQIPYLAQGGWLKANNPRLAVVGDNKHEGEIVAPESKIYNQAKKAVEDAGVTNTNQHFDFTIKLEYPDGKYLIKEINNQQIKDGYVSLLV